MAASPFSPDDDDESASNDYYGSAAQLLPQQPSASPMLPPATQNLSTIPAFISSGVNTANVRQVTAPPLLKEFPGTETIAEANPGKITVYDPSKYTPQVRDHEMTHEFQQSRSDGTIPLPGGYAIAPFGQSSSAAPQKYVAGDPKNYDYGGEVGLLAARNGGKTMADFNPEQQASMVADYKGKQDGYLAKAQAGKATPADLAAMYQTYQAYHPLVQQLANVPGTFRGTLPSIKAILGVGQPVPLAPPPPAPGLPPYNTPGLGVAPADPLLGGRSVPLKVGRGGGTGWGNSIGGAARTQEGHR